MTFHILLGVYCFASVCIGFTIKGLAGFGDPLAYSPLLSIYLPSSIITPGMMPVSAILNAIIVVKNRAYFSLKVVLPISVCILLGILPGIFILKNGAPGVLRFGLGIVIIGLGIEMLTRKEHARKKFHPVICAVISFCSGITAGLFGINLLFLSYLQRVSVDRNEFRANICFVFFVEAVFRGIVYLFAGMFSLDSLILTAVAIPAAFAGLWLGGIIDKKIGGKAAQRLIIYVFIFGGISTVVHALTRIL